MTLWRFWLPCEVIECRAVSEGKALELVHAIRPYAEILKIERRPDGYAGGYYGGYGVLSNAS